MLKLNNDDLLFRPDYRESSCFALDLNLLSEEDKMRELLSYRSEAYRFGLQLSTFAKLNDKLVLGMNPDQENGLLKKKLPLISELNDEHKDGLFSFSLLLELGAAVNLSYFITTEIRELPKVSSSPLIIIGNKMKVSDTSYEVMTLTKEKSADPLTYNDVSELIKAVYLKAETKPVIVLNKLVSDKKSIEILSNIRLLALMKKEKSKSKKNQ